MDGGESREENTLRMWLNSLGLRDAKVNGQGVGVCAFCLTDPACVPLNG